MAENQDRISRIYKKAQEKRIIAPNMTEDAFRSSMSNDEDRKGFYDYATQNGMDFPEYGEFQKLLAHPELDYDAALNFKAEQPSSPATQAAPEQPSAPAQPANPSVAANPAPTNDQEYQENLKKQNEGEPTLADLSRGLYYKNKYGHGQYNESGLPIVENADQRDTRDKYDIYRAQFNQYVRDNGSIDGFPAYNEWLQTPSNYETFGKSLQNNVMAGLAPIAQIPYRAIQAIEDAGSALSNKIFGTKYKSGHGAVTNFVNEYLGGNYFKERGEQYAKESDHYRDGQGIIDSLAEGEIKKAAGKLTSGVVQNAPNLSVSIAMGRLGAERAAGAFLGTMSALDKYSELAERTDIDAKTKFVDTFGAFVAECVPEIIGAKRYSGMFKNMSNEEVKRVVVKEVSGAWNKFLNGAGKSVNKLMDYAGEGITEVMTDVMNDVTEVALGIKSKDEAFDLRKYGDTFLIGQFSDVPMSSVNNGYNIIRYTNKNRTEKSILGEIKSSPLLTGVVDALGTKPEQVASIYARAQYGFPITEAEDKLINDFTEATEKSAQKANAEIANQVNQTAVRETKNEEYRAKATEQATANVEGITNKTNNYVYRVGVKGREGSAGYAMSGDIIVSNDTDGTLKAVGGDLVTIKFDDGHAEQLQATELTILEQPVMAMDMIQAESDRLFAQYANEEAFKVGDKVYLKTNGQVDTGNSSTITGIDDKGIHVEIIDPNGQPNETVIPHEEAADALAKSDNGELEEGIVEFNTPDGPVRLRDLGTGVYETIVPDGGDMSQSQIYTSDDLQQMGWNMVDTNQAQPAEQPNQPSYPTDENGEPAWNQMQPQQAADFLMGSMSKSSATDYVTLQKSNADKAVKDAARLKPKNLSFAAYQQEVVQIEQQRKSANDMLSYWNNVALAINTTKTEEEQAAQLAQQEKMQQAREQRSKTEVGTTQGTTMAERYEAAPRIVGNTGTTTLSDGRELSGHYVLTSPDAITPSHNVLDNYKKSVGYPTTQDGQSINDRDYTNDPEEQQKVLEISNTYNGNAIKNMPVVSDEGLVYNGNGRVMAGLLAAVNKTDAAYTNSLLANAAQFGFTPEQINSIPNARVVFQLDERLPYNTTSLAIFNEQETQTQNNTGKAAAYARKLTPQAVSEVLAAIDGYNTMDAFFNDSKAPFDLINRLIESGIVAQREKAEMVDGDKLSATGKERLSNILFGTVFSDDVIRLMGDDAGLKNSILRALPQILENKSLGEFSLEPDINDAIMLLYEVRNAKTTFDSFVRQTVINEEGQTVTAAENYSPFQLLLAEEMQSGGVDAFRDVLTAYNTKAKEVQGGQVDIFGDLQSPTELKNLVLQRYGKTDIEQEPAENAGSQTDAANASAQPSNEQVAPAESPKIQGMDYTIQEAEDMIGRMVRNILDENGYEGVNIIGTKVIGSRTRNEARQDSDLDALIEFEGDATEDGLFNLINGENTITIDGVNVDVNPITKGKSGSIEQFMKRSDAYLAEKKAAELAAAEAEVNTNPSEAQKEAGNYKKGHVSLFGFDITIENPKGSVRSGVDKNGKKWSIKMRNDYGYIRGTEGVDGDHIDVFIGPNLNSEKVFVVDQAVQEHPDQFDEHKVMLGFDEIPEAARAYLNNFEKGWKLGSVSGVSLEEFKKWINSSNRKTKRFSEYKSVNITGAQSETPVNIIDALGEALNKYDTNAPSIIYEGEVYDEEDFTKQVRDLVSNADMPNSIKDALSALDNERAKQKSTGELVDVSKQEEDLIQEVRRYVLGDTLATAKNKSLWRAADDFNEVNVDYFSNYVPSQHEALRHAKKRVPTDEEVSAKEAERTSKRNELFNQLMKVPVGSLKNLSELWRNKQKYHMSDLALDVFYVKDATSEDYDFIHEQLVGGKTKEQTTQAYFDRKGAHKGFRYYPNARAVVEYYMSQHPEIEVKEEPANQTSQTMFEIAKNIQARRNVPVSELSLQKAKDELYKLYTDDLTGISAERLKRMSDLANAVINQEKDADVLAEVKDMRSNVVAMLRNKKTDAKAKKASKQKVEKKAETKTEKQDSTEYGAKNTLVTNARYEELKARMRKKLTGQLNMGVDPEMLAIGTEMAVYHIEAGTHKFVDFAKQMITDLGDKIRPYLKSFYNGARDLPGMEENSKNMDTYDVVSGTDIASIIVEETPAELFKEGDNVIYTTKDGTMQQEATIEQVNSDGTYNIVFTNAFGMPQHMMGISKDQLSQSETENIPETANPALQNEENTPKNENNGENILPSGKNFVSSQRERIKNDAVSNGDKLPSDFDEQFDWLEENIDDITKRYLSGKDVYGDPFCKDGKTLDPDEARELFKPLGYNRINVSQFRDLEKVFRNWLFQKLAERSISKGNKNIVLLTGIGGAGKGTALRTNASVQNIVKDAGMVFDAAFNDYKSLEKAIKMAKKAGFEQIQVVAVHNSAENAFRNTLLRAVKGNVGDETGRILPLAYFISSYGKNKGKLDNVKNDFPDVNIIQIDNTKDGAIVDGVDESFYVLDETRITNILNIFKDGYEKTNNNGGLRQNQIAAIREGLSDAGFIKMGQRLSGGPDGGVLRDVRTEGLERPVDSSVQRPGVVDTIGKIRKSKDTRDQSDIWLVNPTDHVNKEEFAALKERAKANKGHWSSYSKNRGFLFTTEEDANNFNNILQNEQTSEQTASDTESVVSEAEDRISQVETIVEDEREQPAREESNRLITQLDESAEKVDQQLMLLGYYEMDEGDFHETGVTKSATRKAVKDVTKVATQLAKDLGVDTKVKASANIPPAGGDVHFRIPLQEGRELYVTIPIVPVYSTTQLAYGDLEIPKNNMIMYRVENPNASGLAQYGYNENVNTNITYEDFLQKVKRACKMYLPTKESPSSSRQQDETPLEYANRINTEKQAVAEKKKSERKKDKKSIQADQLMGDLFADVVDELETINNQPINSENDEQTDGSNAAISTSGDSNSNQPAEDSAREQGETGKTTEQASGRTDGGRGDGRPAHVGNERSGSASSVVESKGLNKRNNKEHGADSAPTGEKERFAANMAAIKLLKELQESGKQATPAQMKVLRQFSGWGGLGSYFPANVWSGTDAYELQQLLTKEEYDAANMSRNSAYFTPADVIDKLWRIADKLGFRGGNMTEGSAGIGKIIGRMPDAMAENTNILAVEIDPITGGILKQLYPDAKVHIDGFQDVSIPNGSQDLVMTNVPFVRDLQVFDKEEKDLSNKFTQIQDFCIAKNIRKLREGGIGIFISGKSALDNSKELRKWIVGEGTKEGQSDVIGAFRLNKDTFGGTSATADIIVVRKRVNGVKSNQAIDVLDTTVVKDTEVETGTAFDRNKRDYVPVMKRAVLSYNKYFVEHPEYMGGEMSLGADEGDTRFGGTSSACYPRQYIDQNLRLDKWIDTFRPDNGAAAPVPIVMIAPRDYSSFEDAKEGAKQGQMVLDLNGIICTVDRGKLVPADINANKVKGQTKGQVLKDYIAIKDALQEVLDAQVKSDTDEVLKAPQRKLNAAYDNFVKKYGPLNKNVSITFLKNDIDFASIAALEIYKEQETVSGKKSYTTKKTDVFSKRVIGTKKEATPETVKDGVVLSIQQYGKLRLDEIAKWLGKSEEDVKTEALQDRLIFIDPVSNTPVIRHEYLSGNVREKLQYAKEHNPDGQYDANIEELEKVIPMNIPAPLIHFSLGSTWIETKLYDDFLKEKYGLTNFNVKHIGGRWVSHDGNEWSNKRSEANRAAGVRSEQLNMQVYGSDLFMAAMNNVPYVVQKQESYYEGGQKKTRTVTDKDASQACATRIDEIKDEFNEWVRGKMQQDDDLSERMEKVYNEKFNAIVPLKMDEQFLSEHLPGQNHKYTMYPHQQQGIVRGTMMPTMLAHEVGTGKSFTLMSIAMEMRRLGTAKKPMIVVQNATTAQFVSDAKELYPNSKILTVSERDRTAEGRQEFYAKIKYNDWDLIIVPQSVFDMIPDSEDRMRDFIQEKIDEKIHVLDQMREEKANERDIKRVENEIDKLRDDFMDANISGKKSSKQSDKDLKKEQVRKENAATRAKKMLDRRVDDVADFDAMGIDALLIDEAHNYKHLGFATMMQRGVKGIDPSYSKRAAALYLKMQSVYEKSGHKNVVMATGTPISNTAAEIWTFMKYLLPKEVMEENEIYYFDDFVRNFGRISQSLEFATNGKFKENTRFSSYINIPELARLWGRVADTVLTEEAKIGDGKTLDDKVPQMEGGKQQDVFLEQSASLINIMAAVRNKLEEYELMSPKEKREKSYIPLTMYGIAKRAAIDPRLVNGEAVDEPDSKTNKAVEETLRALKDSSKYNGTVAIFCDNYRRLEDGKEVFNIFKEIKDKLVKKGVPEDQIAIMESGMTDQKKQRIFDDMRSGNRRVILGTTATLGTGVNIQTRLFTLIHMDAPDRPMDMTQREGRILRQGNLHKEWGIPVRVFRFGVKDSLDVTGYQRLQTKAKFINAIMKSKDLVNNNQEGRVIEEEEEGLYDNPVAVLSGSQYAMLKSQAEREYRKFLSKKTQHDADQIYIVNRTRQNEGQIRSRQYDIEVEEARIKKLKELFPDGKPKKITIDGLSSTTDEELEKNIREVNKRVYEKTDKLKKDPNGVSNVLRIPVLFDGLPFTIIIMLEKKYSTKGLSVNSTVEKIVGYSYAEITGYIPCNSVAIDKVIAQIMDNELTGKQSRETIQYAHQYIARLENENEEMAKRKGKPFEFGKELDAAKKLVDEYTEKMKEEMAEKEAKYANRVTKNVSLSDLAEGEDVQTDDTESQIGSLPYGDNLTEAQQLAYDAVREALDKAGIEVEEVDDVKLSDEAEYSIREEAAPKKTGIGYKVFRIGRDGKLYPPMVANPNGEATPTGVWLNADAAPIVETSKTGRPKVKSTGSGTLAFRPGWHLGEIPYALQFNRKDADGNRTLFPKDFVWAEVEYANDIDYQDEAMKEGVNPSGNFQHSLAGLKRVPVDGSYRYRTNPNPETDPWIITGAMKVNRVLSNEEVDELVRKAGREPQVRELMQTPNGIVYGWAQNGKIYLTQAGVNPNTALHEYTHLWAKAMQKYNPEGWQSIVDTFKDTPYWDNVVNDSNYSNLKTDDAICSEALARYSGTRGANRLQEEADELLYEAKQSGSPLQVANTTALLRRVKTAIGNFWKWVSKDLFGIKKFTSAEEIADRVLYDLFSGTQLGDLNNVEKEMQIASPEKLKYVKDWLSSHPHPQYQMGEGLDNYKIRLKQWEILYKQFQDELNKKEFIDVKNESTQIPPMVKGVRPERANGETARDYAVRLKAYFDFMKDADLTAQYVGEINRQADAAAKYIKKNSIKRALIDAAKPIEDFQDWMVSHGAKIDGDSNAYQDTFLASGRVSNVSEALTRDLIRPLAQQIAKIIAPNKETGKSRLDDISIKWNNMDVPGSGAPKLDGKKLTPREIIGVYAQAKDCEEAYEKGLPDRGAAGFVKSLGMTYKQIIDEVESVIPSDELNKLWELIRKSTKFALEYDYQSGRISKDTFDEFNSREYYVPQRGWRERDNSGIVSDYEPVGKRGNDPYNAALVKARGRQTLASDPFAYIMSIDASSIISSENNKIKQKFLQFCLDNEDLGLKTGAFRVKKYWLMNLLDENGKVIKDEDGQPVFTVSYSAPSEEDIKHDKEVKDKISSTRRDLGKVQKAYQQRKEEIGPQLEKAYEAKIAKLEKDIDDLENTLHVAWNATNSMIEQRTKDEKKQHEVVVLKNGQKYIIELQDEKLANSINKKFKQHQEQLFSTIGKMRNATRFMSAMLTQYNPEFAASNFARDFQVAIATLSAEHKELVALFMKNFAACQSAVWQYAWNDKVRDREKYAKSEMGQFLKEYFESGAPTGFSYMKDLNRLREDFDKLITEKNWKRGVRGAIGVFSALTEVSETAVRFAGYVTARQSGMKIQDAAYLSKELTTNFDRAGEAADSGWMSWFSFFRATLNGNIKFLKALKKMPVAYSLVAVSYFAMGILNQLLNPNDPDDETWASDYTRESNFVFGKIRIPTAHFMRMFFAAGVNAVMWLQGSKTFGHSVYDTSTFITNEMLPNYLNVFGNSTEWDNRKGQVDFTWEGLLQGLMPTPLSPVSDVFFNRDFKGATINKEPFAKSEEDTKDILLSKDHTLPIYKWLTQAVYETMGGNMNAKYKSDDPAWRSWLFDTSASSVEHVVEGYIPAGADMFITLGEAIYDAATGTPTSPDKWPFVRKFYNAYTPERAYNQQYYLLNSRVSNFEKNMKDYQKNDRKKYNELRLSDQFKSYSNAKRLVSKKVATPTTNDVELLMDANKQWTLNE